MTPAQFRRVALRFPEVIEGAHHGHADFRVAGRVIASLGYPSVGCAVIMLSPQDQDLIVRDHGAAFSPAVGKWGASGSTVVALSVANPVAVESALEAAWRRRAPRKVIESFDAHTQGAR